MRKRIRRHAPKKYLTVAPEASADKGNNLPEDIEQIRLESYQNGYSDGLITGLQLKELLDLSSPAQICCLCSTSNNRDAAVGIPWYLHDRF